MLDCSRIQGRQTADNISDKVIEILAIRISPRRRPWRWLRYLADLGLKAHFLRWPFSFDSLALKGLILIICLLMLYHWWPLKFNCVQWSQRGFRKPSPVQHQCFTIYGYCKEYSMPNQICPFPSVAPKESTHYHQHSTSENQEWKRKLTKMKGGPL